MQIISGPVNEIIPQFIGSGVNVTQILQFYVIVYYISEDDFFLIFSEETGNFPGRKDLLMYSKNSSLLTSASVIKNVVCLP